LATFSEPNNSRTNQGLSSTFLQTYSRDILQNFSCYTVLAPYRNNCQQLGDAMPTLIPAQSIISHFITSITTVSWHGAKMSSAQKSCSAFTRCFTANIFPLLGEPNLNNKWTETTTADS